MAKPSPILEKRMQELESDVNDFISFSSDAPSHQLDLYYKDFDQRVAFLKNLLSAEITSSPENPPLHLERIQQRLSEIESSFTRTCVSEPVLTCLCEESDEGGADDDQEVVVSTRDGMEEKRHVAVKRGGFCGGFGVGVVVGMVVMGFVTATVLGGFSYLHVHYPVCLAPT